MEWAWNWLGALGVATACVIIALGLFILLAQRSRPQNQALAVSLFLGGVGLAGGLGVNLLTVHGDVAFAAQVISDATTVATVFVYLAFLGTISSPYSKPFASATARRVLYGCAVASAVIILARPELVVSGATRVPYATVDAVGTKFHDALFKYVLPVTFASGILVTWSSFVRTPRDSPRRKQAKAYALAATWFDVVGVALGVAALFRPWSDVSGLMVYLSAYSLRALVYAGLLAYGIFKSQLFDIDLKVKVTLRRGTVAAAFVAVFFIVSELAQTLLSDQMGPIAGVVAAGALVFALAPLQRAAERISDAAMPRVQDTAEYRVVRKREVYRAAVEGALEDGAVSNRERAMLARLADQLGLGPLEMHEIEREALDSQPTA